MSALTELSQPADRMKVDAQKHWSAICKAAIPMSVNSLRIGFHAAYLKRNNLFGILGFGTEKEAQKASNTKDSTWYNVIRIAEAYPNVEEEVFVAMRLSNAETMMDLSDRKRQSEKWLKLAAETPIAEFKDLVDEELDGKERPSNGKEKVVSITIKAPKSRKKFVEEGLESISEELGCKGDHSKALELVIAERGDGISLIGSITAAINDIAEAKGYGQLNLTAAEVLEKVYEKLDLVVDRFRKALEAAQNGNGEE